MVLQTAALAPARKVADMVEPVEWGTELMPEKAERMVVVEAEVEKADEVEGTECCSPLQLTLHHLSSGQFSAVHRFVKIGGHSSKSEW